MYRSEAHFEADEDYDAMGTYDAGKEDIENTIETMKMKQPTMTMDKDSVVYLTYQSGSSNKFHVFFLAQDRSGSWFAFNGYARIGYSPQIQRIYGPASVEQCRRAMRKKITTKERKGYSDYFKGKKWSAAAEMQYMELPVIPDSYGTDSATEMSGRGVPVWYGSAEGGIMTECVFCGSEEAYPSQYGTFCIPCATIVGEIVETHFTPGRRNPAGFIPRYSKDAEGMEMTPDIEGYPGLPVIPDSYGTNSALESGQGVPVWYGSAEEVSGDIVFTARQFVDKLHDISPAWYEDVLDTIAWQGYGRVGTWSDNDLGNMILHEDEDESMSAETFEARGGEMAHMTPDLLWENIGGFWKAVGINPDYDMGGQAGNAGAAGGEGSGSGSGEEAQAGNGNEGGNGESQQEEEQQQPHDQRPPNQDGGNPDSVSAAETEMGLPVIPDSYGTDSATEMGGRGVPVWYGSAEDANPSGGSTGNQVVSWESGGLSSPSGPPSDIYWAEGGRGNWSEADAAHALLRRKSKKQRTIDRKRSRRQKYSAEGERIRTASELVDYVDTVWDGSIPTGGPFTIPHYLQVLVAPDLQETMRSDDELDLLFRDGSMASCIYDARSDTLNTFVVAYDGDTTYNSETIDSYDWDKTEYEKKDLEIVKPFGTAMKATMGVAAGTAAILGITIGLLKIGEMK